MSVGRTSRVSTVFSPDRIASNHCFLMIRVRIFMMVPVCWQNSGLLRTWRGGKRQLPFPSMSRPMRRACGGAQDTNRSFMLFDIFRPAVNVVAVRNCGCGRFRRAGRPAGRRDYSSSSSSSRRSSSSAAFLLRRWASLSSGLTGRTALRSSFTSMSNTTVPSRPAMSCSRESSSF